MHMIETPQSSQIESAGHENDVLHVLFRSGGAIRLLWRAKTSFYRPD